MIQVITLWLFTGFIGGRQVNKGSFSVTRSTLPALKATVMKEFENYLWELQLYKFISHVKTTYTYSYGARSIVFFSLDDSHKLRGRSHDWIWFNEVTDIDFETWNQGVMRTNYTVYNDYNPSGDPFIRTEIEEKRAKKKDSDVYVDVSVYTDNPFLPDLLVQEIKNLEFVDKDLFNIYTRGIWVSLKGLIYPNVLIINAIPLIGKSYFGVDFGYTAPSVLVQVVIDKDNIYIDCLIHERQLLIHEMAKQIKEFTTRNDTVWCDAAEPRTIEELRRRGVNARPAKKGRDSVRQAITFIKQHTLHLTAASVETKKEWQQFKWSEDREGRLIDKPIDFAKHSSDAVSYAINRALGSKIRLL